MYPIAKFNWIMHACIIQLTISPNENSESTNAIMCCYMLYNCISKYLMFLNITWQAMIHKEIYKIAVQYSESILIVLYKIRVLQRANHEQRSTRE